jgi:hypothetical protein
MFFAFAYLLTVPRVPVPIYTPPGDPFELDVGKK